MRFFWIVLYSIGDLLRLTEPKHIGKHHLIVRRARETGTRLVKIKLASVKVEDFIGLPEIKEK